MYKKEQKEFVISKKLLQIGTSIGANINEALTEVSKADFEYILILSSSPPLEKNLICGSIEHNFIAPIQPKMEIGRKNVVPINELPTRRCLPTAKELQICQCAVLHKFKKHLLSANPLKQ